MDNWVLIAGGILLVIIILPIIAGGAASPEFSGKALLIENLKKNGVDISGFSDECLNELVERTVGTATNVSKLRPNEGFHSILVSYIETNAYTIASCMQGDFTLFDDELDKKEDDPIYQILKKYGLV